MLLGGEIFGGASGRASGGGKKIRERIALGKEVLQKGPQKEELALHQATATAVSDA